MELLGALFAGQMESTENSAIEVGYIEYCKKNLAVDLTQSPANDGLIESHLRLVSRSLTLFNAHSKNKSFSHFLGYSVGQFAALAAAGAITHEKALDLVFARAKCLDEARKDSGSQLITILGVPAEKVEEVVNGFSGKAYIGAYNSKMNVMVGFQSDIYEDIIARIKALAPIKIVEPKGFGAWHTPFMKSAADKFADYLLKEFDFKPVETLLIENIEANTVNLATVSREDLINNLIASIYSPVQFGKMVSRLQSENVMAGVEFGVSPFLGKLTPFINRNLKVSFAN